MAQVPQKQEMTVVSKRESILDAAERLFAMGCCDSV